MADFTTIKTEIDANIVPYNDAQEITGEKLNTTLQDLVDDINAKKSDPVTISQNAQNGGFDIAVGGGTPANVAGSDVYGVLGSADDKELGFNDVLTIRGYYLSATGTPIKDTSATERYAISGMIKVQEGQKITIAYNMIANVPILAGYDKDGAFVEKVNPEQTYRTLTYEYTAGVGVEYVRFAGSIQYESKYKFTIHPFGLIKDLKAAQSDIVTIKEDAAIVKTEALGRLYPFVFEAKKDVTAGQFVASKVDIHIPSGKFHIELINKELLSENSVLSVYFNFDDGTRQNFALQKSVSWQYNFNLPKDTISIEYYWLQGGGASVLGSGELSIKCTAIEMTDADMGMAYKVNTIIPDKIKLLNHQATHENFLDGINHCIYHFNLDWTASTQPIIMGQTLSDIRLAKRLGFNTMEFNTHLTSDNVILVTHGSSNKLGYGFIGVNNEDVTQWSYTGHTFAEFEATVRVNSSIAKYREKIPTLEACLRECVRLGIKPYVNVTDASVIAMVEKVMGCNCYYLHGAIDYYKLQEHNGYYGQAFNVDDALAACDKYDSRFIPGIPISNLIGDGTLVDNIDLFHQKNVKVFTYDYASAANTLLAIYSGMDGALSTNVVNDFHNGNIAEYTQLSEFGAGAAYDGTTDTITLNAGETYSKSFGAQQIAKASLHIRFIGKLKFTMGGVANYVVENDGSRDIWVSCSWLYGSAAITIEAVENTTIYDAMLNVSKC